MARTKTPTQAAQAQTQAAPAAVQTLQQPRRHVGKPPGSPRAARGRRLEKPGAKVIGIYLGQEAQDLIEGAEGTAGWKSTSAGAGNRSMCVEIGVLLRDALASAHRPAISVRSQEELLEAVADAQDADKACKRQRARSFGKDVASWPTTLEAILRERLGSLGADAAEARRIGVDAVASEIEARLPFLEEGLSHVRSLDPAHAMVLCSWAERALLSSANREEALGR